MALRIQTAMTHLLSVERLQRNEERNEQFMVEHPSLGDLLHIRAETLIYQTLSRRTAFLGRLLNLEG